MKHFCVTLAALLGHLTLFAQHYDLLIRGGKVVDGTGNSWFYADVAIKDGKVAKIGALPSATAARIVNAKGLIVCPGFIDVHTHIEEDEF